MNAEIRRHLQSFRTELTSDGISGLIMIHSQCIMDSYLSIESWLNHALDYMIQLVVDCTPHSMVTLFAEKGPNKCSTMVKIQREMSEARSQAESCRTAYMEEAGHVEAFEAAIAELHTSRGSIIPPYPT